jgi:hypothetical protein
VFAHLRDCINGECAAAFIRSAVSSFMSNAKPQTPSKVSDVVRTFASLPMFLVLTVILWEMVIGAWLLSDWCYDKGWPVAGLSSKVLAIAIGAITAVATVRFIFGWIGWMIRAAKGSDLNR